MPWHRSHFILHALAPVKLFRRYSASLKEKNDNKKDYAAKISL